MFENSPTAHHRTAARVLACAALASDPASAASRPDLKVTAVQPLPGKASQIRLIVRSHATSMLADAVHRQPQPGLRRVMRGTHDRMY